jgi:cytoskeletal protein RodZ
VPLSVLTSRSPLRALGSATAALVLTVALAGCGDDSETPDASASASESSSPSPSKSSSDSSSESPSESPSGSESEDAGPALEVEVEGDEVKPVAEQVDLAVGERLTITVTADRAGELHVHSDPEHSFAFGPGTKTFRLTIATPGSVDIEEHESEALVARVLVR